jgi:hypothetical protein
MKQPIAFLSQGHTLRGQFYLAEREAATNTPLPLTGFTGEAEAVLGLVQNPDPYGLRFPVPALAARSLLLVGGWDDPSVTIEGRILPLYRALVRSIAESVQVEDLQDNPVFERGRDELALTVSRWVKSLNTNS